ncbi:DUF2806 domain-containing protein [Sorangium sp. So ce281]|uniref:DUF2806 domain-containing protein n=1 Tax=unclassified Sorangium TaxID=2621164 RepID=UPI003F60622F
MPSLLTVNANVKADLKGINKLFGMLKSYFGVKIVRKKAEEESAARIIAAEADAKVKLISARADAEVKIIESRSTIDERKVLIQGEHEIGLLEQNLRSELAVPEEIAEADFEVIWEEPEAAALASAHRGPFQFVEERRLHNIKQVTQETIKALPAHAQVSDEPVDPDVYARIFDNVKDVSKADMQRLWGKLLAGEIARPGTFSLLTIETLRNMTSADAQLFQKYCGFCTNQGEIVLPNDPEFRKEADVSVFEARKLVDLRLLQEHEFMRGGFAEPLSWKLAYRGRIVHIHAPPTRNHLVGHIYRLTTAGIELARLSFPDANDVYVRALCAAAQRKGFNAEVLDARPADAPKDATSDSAGSGSTGSGEEATQANPGRVPGNKEAG